MRCEDYDLSLDRMKKALEQIQGAARAEDAGCVILRRGTLCAMSLIALMNIHGTIELNAVLFNLDAQQKVFRSLRQVKNRRMGFVSGQYGVEPLAARRHE